MENTKYFFNSATTGELRYLNNGNLHVKNGVIDREFSKGDLETMNKAYKGVNRIHKPMALLFWIDCKNGKFKSNWG